jgi:hypothetical protein
MGVSSGRKVQVDEEERVQVDEEGQADKQSQISGTSRCRRIAHILIGNPRLT